MKITNRPKWFNAYSVIVFTFLTIFTVLLKINFIDIRNRTPDSSIYAESYPNNDKIKQELLFLRNNKILDPQNEILINRTIFEVSRQLGMPSGILWCLLFQESRLNHLSNINEHYKAQGIGQFINFSFHEINYGLSRYSKDNLKMMVNILGRDVRPVLPLSLEIKKASSYYYIPTAIVTSAAFLNNRFHQLEKNLKSKNFSFKKELLWFYATIAYNKGTRALLSIWNDIREKENREYFERILNDKNFSLNFFKNKKRLSDSLSKVWKKKAALYASELSTHAHNIASCSMEIIND